MSQLQFRALVLALLALPACSSEEHSSGTPPDSGTHDAPHDAPVADTGLSDAGVDSSLPPSELPLEIDLGAVLPGTPITVTVPAGALGFHVVVRRASGGVVGVESITSPSGQDVVVDYTVVGAGGPTTLGSSGVGAATVAQNPLSSAMPVESGDWVIVFGSDGSDALTAKAYVQKTDDGAFHGGVMDLQIYVPEGLSIADPEPTHTVDAASAANDANVSARVDAFYDALFELYGISRGETSFVSLPSEHRVISDFPALEAAFAKTAPAKNGTALHVVFANGISVFGQEVWGISAGIPGGALETGHAASAIALNVSLGFPAVGDGWTLVHELGHFAGLFHTSQPDGAGGVMSDPLSDTPECTSFSPSCPDGKNIMFSAFWGASGGSGIVASDQQRSVVRGSPLYRTFANGPLAQHRRGAAPPALPPTAHPLCGNTLLERGWKLRR